jgi:hypothetical protein
MKTLIALIAMTVAASAQNYTGQHIGNFDFWSGTDGYRGTGTSIGNFYFYHDNEGNNIQGSRIGDFEFLHRNQNFYDDPD